MLRVALSDNPDVRPSSLYDTEEDYRYDPLSAKEKRANEEIDIGSFTREGALTAVPSAFVEGAFKIPSGGRLVNFSFKGREYLRAIYNSSSKRKILMAGRQVEKCVPISSLCSRANGELIAAGDVKIGDSLVTMSLDGAHLSSGTVSWVSKRVSKPCVRVKTRQGRTLEIALTHPMRTWDGWTEGSQLRVGDRIAAVRQGGDFTGSVTMPESRVRLTAYLIGDGGLTDGVCFTQTPGERLSEFISDVKNVGGSSKIYDYATRSSKIVKIHVGEIYRWMREDGLLDCSSYTKFIPPWVFDLSMRQTSLFLNRLWSTDGHIKKNSRSKYSLEYCSMSKLLVRQVQSLLWKFGIPSKIRENWPSIYKKRGERKFAYILRVETQKGATRLLKDIGALGKSEKVKPPTGSSSNNRDTYPKEINKLIAQILASRGEDNWHENRRKSLHKDGLRRTLKYPPTRNKLLEYVRFFRSDSLCDQGLVDVLAAHTDTDLYWDRVVEITPVGICKCVDFEVGDTHNFVVEGLVAHNSTLLGNVSLSYLLMNPYFRALYVSPSNQQTKVFSRDRIAEPIELSPFLKQTTNNRLLKNVFEKRFINHSQITLRFAFLNADRCLHGSSLIHLADGSLASIKELAEAGKAVRVVTSTTEGKPYIATATNPHLSARKRIVRVETDYPVPLMCSFDHPILTQRGWVNAEDLLKSDFVAAPHHSGKECAFLSVGEDMAWLIGAMLAEGECNKPSSVRFTNSDKKYLREFEVKARRVGLSVGSRVEDSRPGFKTCWNVGLYSDRRGQGINGAKALLWSLGEFGKKAEYKKIPRAIWSAPKSEKIAFLRALFWGDGWCSPDDGGARAGYSSASKELIEGLARMLWNFGIRSAIYRKRPSTKKAKVSYTLSLTKYPTERLLHLIGHFRKCEVKTTRSKDDKDRIPVSYALLRRYLKEHYGLSTHSAWTRYRIQLRPGNVKDSIGRRVLLSIAYKLNDSYLKGLCDPSRSWVRVKGVFEEGVDDVYDLTVEESGCFVADGLVVHNTRGIPSDLVVIDEFQDILLDNVPVIEECASHSSFKYFIYAGTPKSLDNSIEYYWSRFSTQNEWVVPCKRHGTPKNRSSWHWNVLDEENIGPDGLICSRCRKLIRPDDPDACWSAINPNPNTENPFEGFRIPQLMVPWMDWNDILNKQRVYSRAKFYNEVLGRSYDSGTRPLTRRDVRRNCWDELSMQFYKDVKQYSSQYPIFMGIDWGSGENSYTVVCLGGYLPFAPERFTWFYWHRFEGVESEPAVQIKKIRHLVREFNVQKIGVDYGGGFWPNDELVRYFGADKVKKYQWVGNVKKKVKFDAQLGVPRHLCHRTEVMSDVFNAIKRANVFWFPRWEEFEEPFAIDMLNIFSEYNDRLRMNIYKCAAGRTDDSFHAMVFGFLASFYIRPRADVILPTKEIQREHGLVSEEDYEDTMDDLDITSSPNLPTN